ncbi:VWA domain-containing protein [Marinihelvus fidelis]|uniref:VWA domain-containing protein n=1 Tax=Marinihelvus fidelis TaxID=2613842 RepID=A0A5N0TD31_9GAMM|nr:vWA domain-containing protein [Marinihelvus fidelis]KAA9132588.1 VWA domain-containing protein [Marinihelvus fidelis]
MKIPDRETAVFTTSAVDLFASALGAFILLMMLLFPYYQRAGSGQAFSDTWALMQERRARAADTETLQAERERMQSELEQLMAANRGTEAALSRLRNEARDIERQLADTPVDTSTPEPEPTPPPRAPVDGVEFSILGLASESRSFVIVVDMSGSMLNYESLVLQAILDILGPLDADDEFAIVGYQGNPQPVLWRWPQGTTMAAGTPDNLAQAREFARGLSTKFVGSTPTLMALQAAFEYPANAVILMSDGEPNSPPGYIIQNITGMNQFRQTELHTVAIGDYTHNRNLVMFLQTLARLNNGDFVGVSR